MCNKNGKQLDRCWTKSPPKKNFIVSTVDRSCTTTGSQWSSATSHTLGVKMSHKEWSEISQSQLFNFQKSTIHNSANKMICYRVTKSKTKSWIATAVKRACNMSMASHYNRHIVIKWMLQDRMESLKIIMICLKRIGRKVFSKMMFQRYICSKVEEVGHLVGYSNNKWCRMI